ncbi:hypothetical protein GCM10010353_71540 [Streptomyces chryseus]|nr:hypothetical protein GCM10010353_71540 [Streptomyces chryseus]
MPAGDKQAQLPSILPDPRTWVRVRGCTGCGVTGRLGEAGRQDRHSLLGDLMSVSGAFKGSEDIAAARDLVPHQATFALSWCVARFAAVGGTRRSE